VYGDGPVRRELDSAGVRCHSLGLDGGYRLASAARRIARVVHEENAAVVHSSLVRSGLACRPAAAWRGVPLLHSLVDEPLWSSRRPAEQRTWRRRVLHQIDRASAPLVTRFVANSHAVAESYARSFGLPPSRIEVIHRGREIDPVAPGTDQLADLRRQLSVPPSAPILLNVGRLHAKKEQETLVAALPSVLGRHPETVLVIVGEGDRRERIVSRARELGVLSQVRLTGHRDDVAAFLALASVFVFPSSYEGQPGALIEAAQAGCPIVASDIPVHRETLHAGESALLTPVGDHEALAAAVNRLLSDPALSARLGATARERSRLCFSVDAMVARHEDLYLRLAAAGRSHR
jgi:glycosyltransferase involved in cell wall biosynthesis